MEEVLLKKMQSIVRWSDDEGDGIFSPGKVAGSLLFSKSWGSQTTDPPAGPGPNVEEEAGAHAMSSKTRQYKKPVEAFEHVAPE